MTIGRRIAATCGLLTAFSVLLGVIMLVCLGQISSSAQAASEQKVAMLAHVISGSREEMSRLENQIADQDSQLQTVSDELGKLSPIQANREAVARFAVAHARQLTAWGKIRPLSAEGKAQAALAQGTSEQAALLEKTSASGEEMTSMTRKNADNSQQCAKLMLQVDEVNLGSQEQARGGEQISKAIVQIEQVTQRAAASSKEAASASEQLAAQAESNRAILQNLKKLVN